MRFVSAGALAVPALLSLLSGSAAHAAYTPLAFGPLVDPGNGQYFTNVYDISADGQSYVGVLNTNQARYIYNGTAYSTSGIGAAVAITPDGTAAVGGLAGNTPQRWNLADAAGSNIAGQAIAFSGGPNPGLGQAYGTNASATAFSISTPTGVLTGSGYRSPQADFMAMDISAFAGANRGIASTAPVALMLGFVPGVNANAWRWNYETGSLDPLLIPAGGTAGTVGTVSNSMSADGSVVGGNVTIPSQTALAQPAYWDADGIAHTVPGVGPRVWGNMSAMNYTGTIGGGNIFGPGFQNNAFITELGSGTSYNLNELFAAFIPDGWILTTTTHISNDGSRIFCQALAPDGSVRTVVLEGDVPAPGAAGLLVMAGALAGTRRRR
ncbi:MAG: hypothetical protein KDA21_13095 [Phycisphaerales bacterium]|nr:hypothetical protein [Phycisphaerales bacterium]